ncbi:MAG: ATP-binding protein [Tahibacter sp.]
MRADGSGRWRADLLFWGSLLLALGSVWLGFRLAVPPSGHCLEQVLARNNDSWQELALPLHLTPREQRRAVLTLRATINYTGPPTSLQAIYLGEATPFYRASVNGVELTPTIDILRRDLRDLGPHLHPLVAGLLHDGENVIELELPLSVALSELRVGQLCVADYVTLEPVYRLNWWRQVGVPRICLALLGSLGLFAVLFWRLGERPRVVRIFAVCVFLMLVRAAYLAFPWKPFSPLVERVVSDVSILLLLWTLYLLIGALWNVRLRRWEGMLSGVVIFGSAAMLVTPWWDWHLRYPQLNNMVWLVVAANAGMLGVTVARAARRAHPLEWRVVLWAMVFGVGCCAMEAATFNLAIELRRVWIYPLGTTVIALAFGVLLTRRSALGMDVLNRSAAVLARDIDLALREPTPTSGAQWVDEISSTLIDHERQRVLRDIHDGFGSRLVAVLSRLRREQPGSAVYADMQRALLDMRLMIDAMDESARSLDIAMAMLRHRLEPLLSGAGLDSDWNLERVDAVQVDDRRKLMQLLRCLEELLSNAMQHASARRIAIGASRIGNGLYFSVADDGCGLPLTPQRGNGLRNLDRRIQILGGHWKHGPGIDGRGVRFDIVLPRI